MYDKRIELVDEDDRRIELVDDRRIDLMDYGLDTVTVSSFGAHRMEDASDDELTPRTPSGLSYEDNGSVVTFFGQTFQDRLLTKNLPLIPPQKSSTKKRGVFLLH